MERKNHLSKMGFSKLSPNRSEKVENRENDGKKIVEKQAGMLITPSSAMIKLTAGEQRKSENGKRTKRAVTCENDKTRIVNGCVELQKKQVKRHI